MQGSRDLIDSLLRRKSAERVGVDDHPWNDTLSKWVQQGMPVDTEGNPVDVVNHFGFDMVGVGGWIDRYAKRGVEEILQETDEWKVVRNGSGAAKSGGKAVPFKGREGIYSDGTTGTPYFIDSSAMENLDYGVL